jgi:hypothetical protein
VEEGYDPRSAMGCCLRRANSKVQVLQKYKVICICSTNGKYKIGVSEVIID